MASSASERKKNAYVEEELRKRFQHVDLEQPVAAYLFKEALRRRLGLPKGAP